MLVDRARDKANLEMSTFVRFAYFYAGKEKREGFLRETIVTLLNHDEVPDEVVDLALDVMTGRVEFRIDKNLHNGLPILQFWRVKKCLST
jgi:hypothetical protein